MTVINEMIAVGKVVLTKLCRILCLWSNSFNPGKKRPIVSRLRNAATGSKTTHQRKVSSSMISVIDQALVIRVRRERYVFVQTTSAGAGAAFTISVIGSGEMIA